MRVVGIVAFLLFSFFTRVKPHHLLQKCSFFLIKLAASMIWILNSEPQNHEGWFRFAHSFFIKWKEYIPSIFDIHYSIFDILLFRVSFSIKLAASAVALTPDICPPLNPVLIIGY
jgi:hypothetical protein